MEYRLGDLYEVSNGLSKSGDCFGTGYPFLSFSTVFNNYFIPDEISNLVQSTVKEQNSFSIKTGDVFITRTSETIEELGMSCVALKDYPKATYNGFCKRLRPITENTYPLYMGYYFRTAQFRANFLKVASLITRASLRNEDLLKFKVDLPDIETQKKIASVLSNYDNLIENNNKRIAILEQMAENLYKEWFVRFRFPGYENAEFENGIPKGWEIKRMNDFCYVTDGTHDSPKPCEEGVPLITGKCLTNGFIDFDAAYLISIKDHEKIKKRSGLSTGDILFSNIGTVGNCCIVNYNQEFSVKNVIIFKPESMVKTAYLYYWMTSHAMQEIFATQTNGASQQFVGLTFMRQYKVLVPNEEILNAFGNLILPILEQKEKIYSLNLNLIKQRDLLLPRLMSGKLEV